MEAYDYASKFWGYHAYRAAEVDQDVLIFLRKESKVKSSWRVLLHQAISAPFLWGENNIGIWAAAYFGLDRVLGMLIRDLRNGGTPGISHSTALLFAVLNGHEKAALVLIANGADINAKDPFGETALFHAVRGGQKGAVLLLLNHGADVDAETPIGRTPLTFAIDKDDQELAQILLDHGANVNHSDKGGRYPLYWAHSREMSAFLFKNRAAPVILSGDGWVF